MKLASLAIKGLAVVGAFQIYKEWTTPNTPEETAVIANKLDKARASIHNFTRPLDA